MVLFQAQFKSFVYVLFVALLAVLLPVEAQAASSPWNGLPGYSACGGIDRNGNLQPSCGFSAATYVKQSIKRCPQGAFPDLGSCWTCPEGYGRTARKITDDRACSKPAPPQTSRAYPVAGGKCPSGTFSDPRNGGECWKCDPGFGRTTAKVDEWNACGKAFEKARSATFVSRRCPEAGSFLDPRNGGECWKCPEDYDRTAAPVNATNACSTAFTFAPASNRGDFVCGKGEFFDFIDGGTCWTCPQDYVRTWEHVKSDRACHSDKMKWVLPKRPLYGLFGLGMGADDVLAKLIAERTEIDKAVAELADQAGMPKDQALKDAWNIIDNKPWDSPVLSSLLVSAIVDAGMKPVSQQTASEKALLAQFAQLIQWDREFLASQAKQAYDTWIAAQKKAYEQRMSRAGAAIIYADNVYTPPDFNDALVASIQASAMGVGPTGAYLVTNLITPFKKILRPHNAAFRKVVEKTVETGGKKASQAALRTIITQGAEEAAQAGIVAGAEGGAVAAAEGGAVAAAEGGAVAATGVSAAEAAAFSSGPFVIVAAAALIMTMELDKYAAIDRAEGQLRQAFDKARRPVDINVLLQQQGGLDELMLHWAAVMGAAIKPSANFKERLAFYKTGKTPTTTSSISLPDNITVTGTVYQKPQQPQIQVQLTPVPSTQPAVQPTTASTTNPQMTAPSQEDRLANNIQRDVVRQSRNAPQGAMHIEATNLPSMCIGKNAGTDNGIVGISCSNRQTLWIAPDAGRKILVAAEKYCLLATGQTSGSTIVVAPCPAADGGIANDNPGFKWQLTQEGLIQQVGTDQCMTVGQSNIIVLQTCGSQRARQIWRPSIGK